MSKKLIFIFALFFLLLYLIINDSSNTYAIEDCHNRKITPRGVTTLNLSNYAKLNLSFYIKRICSYDKCYNLREDDINKSIDNFRKLFDKQLNENELYEVNVKGYPITEIVVDEC